MARKTGYLAKRGGPALQTVFQIFALVILTVAVLFAHIARLESCRAAPGRMAQALVRSVGSDLTSSAAILRVALRRGAERSYRGEAAATTGWQRNSCWRYVNCRQSEKLRFTKFVA